MKVTRKKLFEIVDSLLGRGKCRSLPPYDDSLSLAEAFSEFFITKIQKLRDILSELSQSTKEMTCPPIKSLFKTICSDARDIHTNYRGRNNINHEKILQSFMYTGSDPIKPSVLSVTSHRSCYQSDRQQSSVLRVLSIMLKSAIVKPLLKKSTLNPEIFKNYRPVSNLSYVSKVIEKVIAARLLSHMQDQNLLDPFQSAYQSGHSTETALLRVHNDILRIIDNGSGVFLVLLDLSAAFDTVDHTILISFLENHIGLKGTVLQMFHSYLSDRSQRISVNNALSDMAGLSYGVLQGSVLCSIEFCMYTLPLDAILRHHKLQYHIYADDTQIYCPFDFKSPETAMNTIINCVSDIRTWMISNKLKINDDHYLITSPYMKAPAGMELSIGQSSIKPSTSGRNLGAMFDYNHKMDIHISSVCRATHFHLRNIGAIRSHLTDSATASLVHSLVTSRLDYCNSLLYGLPDNQLKNRLQRMQNIAVRIVTRSPQHDHITPVLKELQWLPVRMRVLYKLLVLTYRALEGKGPSYLQDIIDLYKPETSVVLRSDGRLDLPWINLFSYGDRAFSVAAPSEWNNLPSDLKDCTSYNLFKSKLKTNLFERYYC